MPATPLDVFRCPLDGIRLIEASAGTGKTWNICGLYLRLLLERGLEVQQILVVTFTNAATAELRERVRSRIVETLAALRGDGAPSADPFVDGLLGHLRDVHALSDDAMARRLDQALQTFDEAAIFTIHGFCQRALEDAPFTAGVPLMQTLMPDDSALRMEVVHDFWRRRIAGDTLPSTVAAHLVERDDKPQRYARLLRRQLAKPLSPVIWPDLDSATLDTDTDTLRQAHAAARELWLDEHEHIVDIVNTALPGLHKGVWRAGNFENAIASWHAYLRGDDPLPARDGLTHLHLFTRAKLKPNKGQPAAAHHDFFAQAETLLALRDAADQMLALQRLALLRELLTDGPPALRRAKRERRVIAFDDMLANLHERLTSAEAPGLATALRTRFPAALIDEFQDTDPLQFDIFERIYGDGRSPLFLVGDPKQAIYSFRHADLHTYLRARDRAAAEYTLAENQRSSPGLIAAVNALFGANPRAFMLDRLSFHPVRFGARPRPAFVDDSAPRAALHLWRLPLQPDGTPMRKSLARQAAADACAAEIARLIGAAQHGDITLGARPLSAGDIAVLVRSHAQGATMRGALARLGVGSVSLSAASVFASGDAEEIERVLTAVLQPARERLLRAALATDLMGLDAAAIETASADEARMLDFVTRFSAYRDAWLQHGVGRMLRQLILHERVAERLLARPDGERRMTNLFHLAECLHGAAETQVSPAALLRWLQLQRAQGSAEEAAQLRLESDRHLVQIVTIHKSKGLEYPVVFCPFVFDGHAGGAGGETLEGWEYRDADGRLVVDFVIYPKDAPEVKGFKEQAAMERAAEGLRLLYVALTRAVHRCYLVVGGYANAKGTTTESGRALIHWLVAGAGQSPTEWLAGKPALQALDAAWTAFASAHAPQIALHDLPPGPGVPVRLDRPSPDAVAALPAPRRIPPGWWIGSYSRLAHGVTHEAAAVDHDLRVLPLDDEALMIDELHQPSAIGAAATLPDDDDILRFPRGPAAGDCMHAVLERIAFDTPSTWAHAIATALRLHPQRVDDAALAERLPRMLKRLLGDLLATPVVPQGGSLAQVTAAQRLVELEFHLPAAHLGAAPLVGLMQQHGYPVPALAFGALEGYLHGFIDLVFEHGGRYWVLDWKSNHLGDTPAHYAAAPVAQAMTQHGYHLQYLLYTVALHRHLQQRLPGYDYDAHLGGVRYLFVRGVRPAWRDADGEPCGVFAHRPPRALIEQLSALLQPMRALA